MVRGDRPGGRPKMVGRGLRRMAAEMRLELLPVGQFDDEALESFVVEFRAGRVLNADAPGDLFLAHEPIAKDAARAASPRSPYHVGRDKQRLGALRLGH